MVDNKYNLYELQKEIPYETVAPILTAWDEQSDGDVTDLARMAYDAGRNSISKEKNKMERVAKLFGKELGTRFTVRYFGTNFDCVFYKNTRGEIDFKVYDEPQFAFCFTEQILYALITGGAVIVYE